MKKLSLYLLVCVALSSCSKKSDPVPLTPAQLLSQSTWILQSLVSSDPDFQSSGQVLIGSEWSFKSNKSFSLEVIVSGVHMSFTGTWSLSSDGKKITLMSNLGGTDTTSEMEILSLTAKALQVKESASGMVNTYTFTAK